MVLPLAKRRCVSASLITLNLVAIIATTVFLGWFNCADPIDTCFVVIDSPQNFRTYKCLNANCSSLGDPCSVSCSANCGVTAGIQQCWDQISFYHCQTVFGCTDYFVPMPLFVLGLVFSCTTVVIACTILYFRPCWESEEVEALLQKRKFML